MGDIHDGFWWLSQGLGQAAGYGTMNYLNELRHEALHEMAHAVDAPHAVEAADAVEDTAAAQTAEEVGEQGLTGVARHFTLGGEEVGSMILAEAEAGAEAGSVVGAIPGAVAGGLVGFAVGAGLGKLVDTVFDKSGEVAYFTVFNNTSEYVWFEPMRYLRIGGGLLSRDLLHRSSAPDTSRVGHWSTSARRTFSHGQDLSTSRH